jgi:SAM-dependent methyltransferase
MIDLRPHFKYLHWRPMEYTHGVPVTSDWADKSPDDPVFGPFKQWGFWTMEEVAILYDTAKRVGGSWLDIGGHTGWTGAHILAGGCHVTAVDPLYHIPEFKQRACDNSADLGSIDFWAGTSDTWFQQFPDHLDGVVIDGDHEPPQPLFDAMNAHTRVKEGGVILFHDLIYPGPIAAYEYLLAHGWRGQVFPTTHKVALCERST